MGNYTDVEANLILMGHRFYSPQYCRFLTRDPSGYEGGINLYAYCRNNPINRFDPLGLDGNGVDFLLGEGISFWNHNLDEGIVGQALHIVPGTEGLGHFKPYNDQKDGAKFGDGLYIAASVLSGGAKSGAGKAVGKVASSGSLLSRFVNFLKGSKCFVAGTSVQMADSTFKPIEQIQAGDQVVSRDPTTGKTEIKPVVRTFQHTAYEIAILELIDPKSGQMVERLRGTPTHPFFTSSGMVAMGDLKPGMQVRSRRGPPLVVKSVTVEKHAEGIAVYNFEVEDDHTYFVGNAEGGAWVHNDCGEVAFGFTHNLPGFKNVVPQAKNYMDLGLDPYAADFVNQLATKMNEASKIHFDLSGASYLNTADGVLTGPTHLNPLGSTNWELRTIWDNPALRSKTTFYRNGKVLSIQDVLKLH